MKGKTHKVKSFADDVNLFLKDLRELKMCYKRIEKFEKYIRTSDAREKCQALPFGKHKEDEEWPSRITVKTSIKVVGIHYINKHENLEKIN